ISSRRYFVHWHRSKYSVSQLRARVQGQVQGVDSPIPDDVVTDEPQHRSCNAAKAAPAQHRARSIGHSIQPPTHLGQDDNLAIAAKPANIPPKYLRRRGQATRSPLTWQTARKDRSAGCSGEYLVQAWVTSSNPFHSSI